MSANLNILKSFINEYKETYNIEEIVYDEGLVGDIKKVQDKLLDEKFFPSNQLKGILNKQIRRARYPMEVAITGQFSAGKIYIFKCFAFKKYFTNRNYASYFKS